MGSKRDELTMVPSGCRDCFYARRREVEQPIPGPPGSPPGSMGVSLQHTLFCHRFPTMLRTEPQHWCGEWREKEMILH